MGKGRTLRILSTAQELRKWYARKYMLTTEDIASLRLGILDYIKHNKYPTTRNVQAHFWGELHGQVWIELRKMTKDGVIKRRKIGGRYMWIMVL